MRYSWSTPRDLAHQLKSSRLGQLVKHAGPRTQARVARDCWLTPWELVPKHESPGIAGRPRRPSDNGPSQPGELVNTADPWNGLKCPGTAGQPRGPSGPGPRCPGELVDPVGPWKRAGVAWDRWSTPLALGKGPESSGTDGQHDGPSNPGPSRLGQLVDPAGPPAWARIARESWLTPRALRTELIHLGELVDPAGPRSQARVSWDSWSTRQAIRARPESPGTSARPCGH